MKYFFNVLYAIVLAFLSWFTGEVVTFIMLGLILITLQNIHDTLKNILKVQKEKLERLDDA